MEIIISSIIAFASTNIDDVFVLMLFFGNRNFKTRDVVIGQYLGISVLILISFLGSLIGLVVDPVYIGILGLVPIFLGVKALIKLLSKKRESEVHIQGQSPNDANKNNVFVVCSTTIANGGDNIGIYIPLFATLSFPQKVSMTLIFLIMVGLWCMIGKFLSRHPVVAKAIDKYGHLVTPIILIFLGLYIIYESGTYVLLNSIIY